MKKIILLLLPLTSFALTKPHTFTSGTSISSSQINSNFDTLYNHINSNTSTTIGAEVGLSADVNVIIDATVPASFDVVYSNSGGYDQTSSSYTVGVGESGIYTLYPAINISPSSSGFYTIYKINGTNQGSLYNPVSLFLDQGDHISFEFNNSGAGAVDTSIDSTRTRVIIRKI